MLLHSTTKGPETFMLVTEEEWAAPIKLKGGAVDPLRFDNLINYEDAPET